MQPGWSIQPVYFDGAWRGGYMRSVHLNNVAGSKAELTLRKASRRDAHGFGEAVASHDFEDRTSNRANGIMGADIPC
jgi:hypothetical protein